MKNKDKNTLREFVREIDLLNTLNGGVAATSVNTEQNDTHIEIKVSAPSVNPEAFQIFIDRNKLFILSAIRQEQLEGSDQPSLVMPLFSRNFDIPFAVDANRIDAVYEDGELRVVMPFKESDSLQRRVDIKFG